MKTLTRWDVVVLRSFLFDASVQSFESICAGHVSDTMSRTTIRRHLDQLCEANLLESHSAWLQEALAVKPLYAWLPQQPKPLFSALGGAITRCWESIPLRKVEFFVATDRASNLFGRAIDKPLKNTGSLPHDLTVAAVYSHYHRQRPDLLAGWISESAISKTRGYGEKNTDAAILGSDGRIALAIEIAGASYAASGAQRLKDIHQDCAARLIPYVVWCVTKEEGQR